ncbi:MAG: hypothetical protein AAF512_04560 [Pseudomonadota bacterium]
MEISFINVDLELEGHESLQPIAEHFGESVSVLGCGAWGGYFQAAFEIAGGASDPDSIINIFCTLINALGPREMKLWKNTFRREFNIGYESGLEPRSYESIIRSDTVSRINAVGASIRITIYPPNSEQ